MKIYLLGFMGAGKTTIGKLLAKEMKFNFIDLDEYIEEKQNLSIPEIFSKFGENEFRVYEKQALEETFELDNVVVSTGGGAPCFFDNIKKINENGTSIYLQFSAEVLASRIKSDAVNIRPLAAQKNKEDLVEFTKNKLNERENDYLQAKIIVSEPKFTPEELMSLILTKIKAS